MKLKDIEKKIGTLSNPNKMPSYAWGIPIEYCDTGMKLAKVDGTICLTLLDLSLQALSQTQRDAI